MVSPAFPLFAEALRVGFSIAAPVGPIGLLTIQRTLERGVRVGLATGLGAATADALYGALGALGTRFLIDALVGARTTLALFGGLVLLAMAWRVARQPLARQAAAVPTSGDLLGCFVARWRLRCRTRSPSCRSSPSSAPWPVARGPWPCCPWWRACGWARRCGGCCWPPWWRWRARLHDAWRLRIQWGSAALLVNFCAVAVVGLLRWAGSARFDGESQPRIRLQ